MNELELMEKVAKCEVCQLWWVPGTLECTAVHYGKGCCHYGDTLMSAPQAVQD